jgi:peptide/nickel transport system permease protein
MAVGQSSGPVVPGAAIAAGDAAANATQGAVRARGYWENAWRRLRRDRLALVSGVVIILFVLIAFVAAPVTQSRLGHGPNDLIPGGVQNYKPVGPFSTVSDGHGGKTPMILGASDLVGRDELLRLLYGAQVSLEVGVLSTVVGLALGLVLGLVAGFYGGLVDTAVSRLTEIVMAFPLLLFLIALSATLGDRLDTITLGGVLNPGVFTLTIVIGLFTWFYPARIVRAQVLSLREKEFVEAARMVGSSNFRIMRSHLVPHLVGTIIVYGTLTVAINILLESTLSFLGVGLPSPNASWGNMLDEAVQFYTIQPWLIVWPGLALLVLTLAFNLLGDGLRDALDPRATL